MVFRSTREEVQWTWSAGQNRVVGISYANTIELRECGRFCTSPHFSFKTHACLDIKHFHSAWIAEDARCHSDRETAHIYPRWVKTFQRSEIVFHRVFNYFQQRRAKTAVRKTVLGKRSVSILNSTIISVNVDRCLWSFNKPSFSKLTII